MARHSERDTFATGILGALANNEAGSEVTAKAAAAPADKRKKSRRLQSEVISGSKLKNNSPLHLLLTLVYREILPLLLVLCYFYVKNRRVTIL
jgi:hypothetical protein